jgi:hypothetical protein
LDICRISAYRFHPTRSCFLIPKRGQELHRPEIDVGVDWRPAARAENLHYALGWFTADVRGVHLVYHNGENPGFRAAVVLAPSSRAGVVVLTNGESKDFIEVAARSLLEQLLQ